MRKRTAILALALSLILGNSVYVPAAEDTGETAAQETAGTEETQAEQTEEAAVSSDTVLLNAQIMYAQYNYDAAIQYLKSQPDFDVNKDYMDLAANAHLEKKKKKKKKNKK